MRRRGVWMVKWMEQEVSKKLDELIEFVKGQENYQQYLEVEKKLKENQKIMTLIESVKEIQKQLTAREVKKQPTEELEQEYDLLLQKLEGEPLYQEFKRLQEELNEEFQKIKYTIEDYFQEKIQS